MTRIIRTLVICICILTGKVFFVNTLFMGAVEMPALYDMAKLKELKNSAENPGMVAFLLKARKYAEATPLSVVGKTSTYAPNDHYYCSIAPYAWPNEDDPLGPYITRDGLINPERDNYDLPKLVELAKRLQYLSIAYYITEDDLYYDSFMTFLYTWFISSETAMIPSFEFAQVVKGRNGNHGMSYGLVDMNNFTPILESVYLMDYSRSIDKTILRELKRWFSQLLDWTVHSAQWSGVCKSPNNIVTGCYVTLIELARFTDNKTIVKQLSQEFKAIVLETQIKDDGRQPLELRRTNGFGYSVKNIGSIVDFSLIMERAGIRYYRKNQKKIDSAFVYLLQFVNNHELFQHSQISDWGVQEKLLWRQVARVRRLSSRKGVLSKYHNSINLSASSDILSLVY